MITLFYGSKKQMKESLIGKSRYDLRYNETSLFGDEVSDNCTVTGSNRPSITRVTVTNSKGIRKLANEFYASITIKNGVIVKIS